MDKKKVFIVNSNPDYVKMLRKFGWKVIDNLKDADLVQFTGGEDVTPEMYGHSKHFKTYCNPERDLREEKIFSLALKNGKPMAGICRGGQFLNVMCGGTMWQDCDKHAITGTHNVTDTRTGEDFQVTSTHHQMMEPTTNGKGEVILTAKESTFKERQIKERNAVRVYHNYAVDIEAIHYGAEKVFCFQPHPEFPGQDELAKRYFDYIEELIL